MKIKANFAILRKIDTWGPRARARGHIRVNGGEKTKP